MYTTVAILRGFPFLGGGHRGGPPGTLLVLCGPISACARWSQSESLQNWEVELRGDKKLKPVG